MNAKEIDRFVSRRVKDFDGVFSVDTLPDLRVFWSQIPIHRTNQVVTGSAYVSKMVAENFLTLSDVDLMRCLSDI